MQKYIPSVTIPGSMKHYRAMVGKTTEIVTWDNEQLCACLHNGPGALGLLKVGAVCSDVNYQYIAIMKLWGRNV